MLSKIIKNNKILDEEKKLFRNIMIMVLLISSSFSFNIFSSSASKIPCLEATITFIRSFNSILSILALGTCFMSYKRLKRDDVYILFLLYLSLSIGIIFGQIDFLSFYYKEYSLSNYLTVSSSLLRICLVLIALTPDNVFKKYMVKNKKSSATFVILYTAVIGSIEKNIHFGGMDYSTDFYVVYNAFLAMIYLCAALVLFKTGEKEKEYIYMVISMSISMLAIKSMYTISTVGNLSFDTKLTSVSITYITFIVIIAGTFVELYFYIKNTKELNQKLSIFYNFAEKNKHSAMLICDDKSNILYANKKAKENYGLNDDTYIEELNKIISNKKHKINNKEEIEKSLKDNGIWRGMIKYEYEEKYIDCSIQVILNNDDSYQIAVTYMDVSEEINKEIELAKLKVYNKERTDFMSNISHELRTPVNIFYSTLQLLDKFGNIKEKDFKDLYNKYRNTLHVNCKRMLRLINNVVDMSKIESGILKGRFDYYNLIAIVEDVTMSVVNYAQLKSINIVFDTNSEESIVYCDPNMIERVMLNLLSNAIKFSPENSTIFINLLVSDDCAEISVKDEGIGISKEYREVIFERFMQADKSLTRKNEGSGIGLSIVKSIVDLHGGYINVDSEVGEGSTFKILIPNIDIETDDYQIYDIQEYTTEVELSDIYEVLI